MDYAINIARLLLARLRIIWGVGLHINYLAKGALPLSLSLSKQTVRAVVVAKQLE